jgi:ABC-2 type transport system permease protein
MNKVWIITKRELGSFFDSLIAYILLIAFLGFSGFFTWMYGADVFFSGQASLASFFNIAYWTLFLFIPLITMRMLAEEKRSGTLDLMLTKAVSDRQIVLGKFMACVLLIFVALLCTIPYYLTVASIGNVDHGSIICGYLALLLLSGAYIAIGIYASSTTNNQIVAAMLALLISLLFHLIFAVIAGSTQGVLAELMSFLSTTTHFDSMTRGVIDSKDLLFFFSIMVMGIVMAEVNLAKRAISGS